VHTCPTGPQMGTRYVLTARPLIIGRGDPCDIHINDSSVSRRHAARASALAGCGQGRDADNLDEEGRAGFRHQPLGWLGAELEGRPRLLLLPPVAGPECSMNQPLPAVPTNAPPGSDARIQVYQDRVARGEQLHHPRDLRMPPAVPDAAGAP